LQAAFLTAYAVMYAGGDKLIDVLGTRRGLMLIMLWWSLGCASQGLATSVVFFGISPFLLGNGGGRRIWIGEAENLLALGSFCLAVL
jgi:ACS family hexuronate transporter-like MFS transporter